MEFYDEKIKALAIEIYELDAEVYKKLGSSDRKSTRLNSSHNA